MKKKILALGLAGLINLAPLCNWRDVIQGMGSLRGTVYVEGNPSPSPLGGALVESIEYPQYGTTSDPSGYWLALPRDEDLQIRAYADGMTLAEEYLWYSESVTTIRLTDENPRQKWSPILQEYREGH